MAGGRIGRYDDGRLNGELVDRAKGLVQLPPEPARSEAEMRDALAEGHRILSRRGITSIRYPGGSPAMYQALERLRGEDRLAIRVDFLHRAPRSGAPEALADAMSDWVPTATETPGSRSGV